MNRSHTPTNNEFEELIASMTEDEQRLVLIFLIMYAMHPCSLTHCPYNCRGYCYTDLYQTHYMEMACDTDSSYMPFEMRSRMIRKTHPIIRRF